jgi:hypothetical protein
MDFQGHLQDNFFQIMCLLLTIVSKLTLGMTLQQEFTEFSASEENLNKSLMKRVCHNENT